MYGNDNDDEWDDAGSTAVVNGFGDSSNDTGKSFGRGRGSSGNSDWAPQGGGDNGGSSFGGGKSGGGSRACFKCGEEGHMSRDCPSGGGGGSRACYKCGEEGHMSRECPQGGGGGSKACFKCGEEGHMSRECPSGGSGGGGSRACYKCGEEGHMSRECPQGGGGGGSRACFKCGEEGHMSRECPTAGGDGEGGDGDKPRPPIYIPPPPPEDEKELFESVQTGINFNKYDAIAVEITGEPPTPKPILSFDEAKLTETIRTNVAKAKYEKPTPVQKYSIPVIYADRDLMACAQTGSGKTAAFLLPVLTKIIENGLESGAFSDKQQPQVIIVGPTRELIIQIHKEALKFAHGTIVKPVLAYGGTSVGHQLNLLSRGCNMLIATPGRLMDFINRGKVGLDKLQYLILDEADRMLDMGFESEIRRLVGSPGIPDKMNRHTLMFSATFPDEVQKLAQDFLQPNYIYLTVGRVGGACTDVTQELVQLDAMDKKKTLMDILANVAESRSRTLVFVDTKRNADYLACYLSQEEIPTTSIHGDRLQREREEALRDFKSGQFPVLIATSVAARGLDIPKVEHVVNYDLPTEIDEYVHRIGRTGRCGNLGKATSFYCHEKDSAMARSLVKVLADAFQDVPDWLEECADGAIGTSFGPKGGSFGGRDARRGGGGGGGSREKADCDYNDGGGFGGGNDDDDWD